MSMSIMSSIFMLPWQLQISCGSCPKSTFDNNSVFFPFLYQITEIHLFADLIGILT